jgi:hypothetical protein
VFSRRSQFASASQALPCCISRHIETSESRVSSPAYWRSENTWSCMSWRVKPPWSIRSWVMISPIRVRSERSVFSSPMIRSKPVSGDFGFDSQ